MPKIKDCTYKWDAVPLFVDPYYVAELFGCTVKLIQKECREGKIKAFKVGDMWRICKDDLIAYTKGGKEKCGSC